MPLSALALVKPSRFHDRAKSPAVFGEQRYILQRIAIDDEQVCGGARRNAAEVGAPQYLGPGHRCGAKNRGGGLDPAAIKRLARLHIDKHPPKTREKGTT